MGERPQSCFKLEQQQIYDHNYNIISIIGNRLEQRKIQLLLQTDSKTSVVILISNYDSIQKSLKNIKDIKNNQKIFQISFYIDVNKIILGIEFQYYILTQRKNPKEFISKPFTLCSNDLIQLVKEIIMLKLQIGEQQKYFHQINKLMKNLELYFIWHLKYQSVIIIKNVIFGLVVLFYIFYYLDNLHLKEEQIQKFKRVFHMGNIHQKVMFGILQVLMQKILLHKCFNMMYKSDQVLNKQHQEKVDKSSLRETEKFNQFQS
ncbi:unnamed protein product [Paramecium sonneborni]|uniref:Transmembrane protein n=1 Tax=Paramecium sonneborni TaxID=65129 RepID=A0A8S1RLB4_9CILI|nr:unnamed protein product [Paramecium sonneborni]